jgi:hypothetical protein
MIAEAGRSHVLQTNVGLSLPQSTRGYVAELMNPHPSYAPISDPSRIMEMINGFRADHPAPVREGSGVVRKTGAASSNRPLPPHLKLHVERDSEHETWSTPAPISSHQVEQLVQHLRTRQRELDQREAHLQASVYRHEQQLAGSQAQLKKRASELEQQLSQVKLQQAQLIKLQQNMIETQTSLRRVIERIVENCEPGLLKQELQKLRFELSEKLDAILCRWEKLKRQHQ